MDEDALQLEKDFESASNKLKQLQLTGWTEGEKECVEWLVEIYRDDHLADFILALLARVEACE